MSNRAETARQLVLDAAERLYATRRRPITSKELGDVCRRQSVDGADMGEAIKALLNDGRLIRMASGVYVPPQAAGQINYPHIYFL